MYVGIYIKNICLLENITSCKRIIYLSPTFSHKMAATSEVDNGNDFGIALVMMGAMFDDMHASCQIRETKGCNHSMYTSGPERFKPNCPGIGVRSCQPFVIAVVPLCII